MARVKLAPCLLECQALTAKDEKLGGLCLGFGAYFGSLPWRKQAGAGITGHAQTMLLLGAKSRAENQVLSYQQLQQKLIAGKKLLPWSRKAPLAEPSAHVEGFCAS